MGAKADDTRPGLLYGRRKFIPLGVVVGLVSVARAIGTRSAAVRGFDIALAAWCAWFCWRYWTNPMPARLAARLQRLGVSGKDGFGSKRWHKAATAALMALVVLFITLIVLAAIQGASPH